MGKHYELKTQFLGPDAQDEKQVKVLNRILTWTTQGISYEADPRHTEIAIDGLDFTSAKGVSSPGAKEEGHTKEDRDELVDSDHPKAYISPVACLNYLAPDRAAIAYSVK